ncbi:P-loop NTPase fold protein [Pseudidiomarina sp.]|uniref:YobI family P-loop NTPase n=1 Tax=Pseudidiomarina sp. TaxID=2081707 RepID=UPI003A96C20A
MTAKRQELNETTSWNLVPLTPKYIETEHGSYVDAINRALGDEKVRNIALSGSYGVGKSSILQKVADQHGKKAVEISLSTLSPIKASQLDETVPKQATTLTNRIQQEIVKQLLYLEKPYKMPSSRFRRIEGLRFTREIGISILAALVATMVFLLSGWTDKIASVFIPSFYPDFLGHLAVFVTFIVLTIGLRFLSHGRIHVSQFSTGTATVKLDDKSVSYFDQYLDEILYFFEMSEQSIVIFEDIDRFNDSQIFETLRALNTLLNSSPQVSQNVRFIYAIKDSIFDHSSLARENREIQSEYSSTNDSAESEIIRANRTKFFDLIIPVVPFITHRSARNIVEQITQPLEQRIKGDLIDIASRFVPDMRLLKNVRNEFIVFYNRIFSGEGRQLKLCETELFAMMLYKSTYISDFEAIRTGKSNLDKLYYLGRQLINHNVRLLEHTIQNMRQQQSDVNSIDINSNRLGKALIAHIERTATSATYNTNNYHYAFAGNEITKEELCQAKFWEDFVSASEESKVTFKSAFENKSLQFSRKLVAEALDTNLDPEHWDRTNKLKLQEKIKELKNSLIFLRSADMGDLISTPDFKFNYEGNTCTFDDVARKILKDGLAYKLLKSKFINRNFTLYTSTFHGNLVSPEATNFIIHHVEQNKMDEHFKLDDDDVVAVLKECDPKALAEPALYNISILDQLLKSKSEHAVIMVKSLTTLGPDQRRFIQAYLNNGKELFAFVALMVRFSPDTLIYLNSDAQLDNIKHLSLMDHALLNLNGNMDYKVDSDLSLFIKNNYDNLTALTSDSLDESQIKIIAEVLSNCGIKIPDLKLVSGNAKNVLLEENLYEINRSNLLFATGLDEDISLDLMLVACPVVYQYILENLDKYLEILDDLEVTISDEEYVYQVLKDVLTNDPEKLEKIIGSASPSSSVQVLIDAPKESWPYLASNLLFHETLANIKDYFAHIGGMDHCVAKLLASSQKIIVSEESDEEQKNEIAKQILTANEFLPSASMRVAIVFSMNLTSYIDVDEIPSERGDLFALLIKHQIIEDNEAAYSKLSDTDWHTRELFIQNSSNFKHYISPNLLKDSLSNILLSEKVDDDTKLMIVEHADDFMHGASKEDLIQLARYTNNFQRQVLEDVLIHFSNHDVPTHLIISLLARSLPSLEKDQVLRVLNKLGGNYPKITSAGREKPRVPNTSAMRSILDKLKEYGVVSRYDEELKFIKVFKHYQPR